MRTPPQRRCLPLEVEAISLHRQHRTVRPAIRGEHRTSWLRAIVRALSGAAKRR